MSSDFDGHTPAPWGVSAHVNVRVTAGPVHVATIPRAGDGDCSPANARLIAAAPDLLAERDRLAETVAELVEALADMLNEVQQCFDFYENTSYKIQRQDNFTAARAALAKARGQA